MAVFNVQFQSYTLRQRTDLMVIVPSSIGWDRIHGTNRHTDFPDKFPCLYMLHGFGGNCMDVIFSTRIESYAQRYQIAVVMPSGCNAAFTNMKYGPEFGTFLHEELPEFCQRMFPISSAREDTFIAGFSMGGYGAFVNAIGYPDRYGAAASIAGTLNVDARVQGQTNTVPAMVYGMYGDPPVIDRHSQDVFVMLEDSVREGIDLPRLYACSGRQDIRAYPRFKMLQEHCEKAGISGITMEENDGEHTWDYCDMMLPRVIEWLLQK